MASLTELRYALAANIRAGLPGAQVNEYVLPDPTPGPNGTVEIDLLGPIEYDKTMGRGHDEWTFTVTVIVGTADSVGAQKNLDRMLASSGPLSIKALIESDTTLGGAAEDVHVVSSSGPSVYGRSSASVTERAAYVGAKWTVTVMARGND